MILKERKQVTVGEEFVTWLDYKLEASVLDVLVEKVEQLVLLKEEK